MPPQWLVAVLAAAALAACDTDASVAPPDSSPAAHVTPGSGDALAHEQPPTPGIDPEVFRAALDDVRFSVSSEARSGPWIEGDDILVVARDPALASAAHATAQMLSYVMPSVRATAWVPGDPPAAPERADVVATLNLASDDSGTLEGWMNVWIGSRQSLLADPGSSLCTRSVVNAPTRHLPVARFMGSGRVPWTGGELEEGLHAAAAIYSIMADGSAYTLALPDPPTATGLPPVPVPDPPLPDMLTIIAGQQSLGVSEAIWFMPSRDPLAAMDSAASAAERAGWVEAHRWDGRAHPANIYLTRPSGCLVIASRGTNLWAHALVADPVTDASTILAPTFAAHVDKARIEDLAPYIGLAPPELRKRFFDRVIAEGTGDDATLLALAHHLHDDRGDDDAALRYLDDVAGRVWRLESFVTAADIGGLGSDLGRIDLEGDIGQRAVDWQRYGFEVIRPGERHERVVGEGESLALIVEMGDGFDAVVVQVRPVRPFYASSDFIATEHELFGSVRFANRIPELSTTVGWNENTTIIPASGMAAIRLPINMHSELLSPDELVAEARRVGPGRFAIAVYEVDGG